VQVHHAAVSAYKETAFLRRSIAPKKRSARILTTQRGCFEGNVWNPRRPARHKRCRNMTYNSLYPHSHRKVDEDWSFERWSAGRALADEDLLHVVGSNYSQILVQRADAELRSHRVLWEQITAFPMQASSCK